MALAATIYTSGEARSAAPRAAAASAPASDAGPGLNAQAAGTPNAGLDTEINAIIDANGGYQIGVALIDLSDGVVHEYGVRQAFVAASTAKVLAAAAYYHLVETGAASLDEPLGDWTAGFQLKEMIQDSDNESWSLIMDAIGHDELSGYAASIGVGYDPESNTLTPAEMAKVLAALYSGELLDADDTAQLLSYMQDTNYESLIPAAVPAGITVFHKYGLLGGELHDAAVLAKDGTAYAFVIYTKGEDTGDIPQRTGVIHRLTEAVAGALF
ncbi:serine hydrolase [Pseudarthrobacter sp. H2]|uniref:serine hydrolase n=1 Tax=Pseudarthrobacter sp. H2 TaxID=3418415 RepID=UPI003CF8F491